MFKNKLGLITNQIMYSVGLHLSIDIFLTQSKIQSHTHYSTKKKLRCKKVGIFGEDSNTKIKTGHFKFKYNIKTLSQFLQI